MEDRGRATPGRWCDVPSFNSELRRVRRDVQKRVEERAVEEKRKKEWLASEDDREHVIEAKFVIRMVDEGYMHLKADQVYRGWSDQIFFGHGPRTIIVEFKRRIAREGRRGEKLQQHFREQFRERKYEVYRAKGWAEAEALFREITGKELRS